MLLAGYTITQHQLVMQMTKDISKERKWNNFLMLTNHYETDSDEEISNYNHSQVFTNTKVMKKSVPLTALKCTTLKDQIPWEHIL